MEKFKILVVDDEPIIRKILEFTLVAGGFQVELAANGNEAVDALRGEHFDLVVTDLEMGEPDGFAVLRTAKDVSPLTRRIVLTGNQDMSLNFKATQIGVDDYFLKPFAPAELIGRVRKSIEKIETKSKAAIKAMNDACSEQIACKV